MTYNVFSGTLNPIQSVITQTMSMLEGRGRKAGTESCRCIRLLADSVDARCVNT